MLEEKKTIKYSLTLLFTVHKQVGLNKLYILKGQRNI